MNKWIKILLLIIGLIVIVFSSEKFVGYDIFKTSQNIDVQSDIEGLFKENLSDFSYYEHNKQKDLYTLYNEKNDIVSYALFSSPYCNDIKGFGGKIPFIILIDANDTIRDIILYDHFETKSWIDELSEINFFDAWKCLSIDQALDTEVDIISGATYTTEALINAINLRLSIFLDRELEANNRNIMNILGLMASFLVLALALISFLMPRQSKKLRIWLLFASVGILGFWQGKFLSIALLHNWLINGLDIKVQIFLFVLLILSILLPVITNKSFYCQYLCPFGATQELVGNLNKQKVNVGHSIAKILNRIKFVVLFVIVVLLVVAIDVDLENLEPFSAFKFKFASLFVIISALIIIFLSIFIYKPWCKFFCPTGALLCLLRGKNKKIKHTNIKFQSILNVSLILLVIVLSFLLILKSKENNNVTETDMSNTKTALDIIFERKSVRNYTTQKVEKEKLEELIKAGMAAPSARNLQPWAFVIIQDKDIMLALADALPYAKMLKNAQAAIVVCGDLNKAATDVDQAYWVQDCSAATQNILIAAEAIGLGAVWTAAYPYPERISPLQNYLNLPDNIIPLNVIPIGYPTGKDKPKDKWEPENLHWEKW
jgi:nitroreductase